MNRIAIRYLLTGLMVCFFTIVSTQSMSAQQQKKVVAIYEMGKTALNLIIEQSAWEGASPAELEGIRQGALAQLEETPITLTLYADKTLDFTSGGRTITLDYKIQGSHLIVVNPKNGAEIDFAFFTNEQNVLTVNKTIILDKRK